METRNALRSARFLGTALATVSVALTVLVSFASHGAAAAIVPVAFGLPFAAVAIFDGVIGGRENHA